MIIRVNEFYKFKEAYIQVLSISTADGTKVGSLNTENLYWAAQVTFYLNGNLSSCHVGALKEIPVMLPTPEAEVFWDTKKLGSILEEKFPGQSANDFHYAISDAEPLPDELKNKEFQRFICVYEGERDEDHWIWYVRVNDIDWIFTAWCDFTGWDCQSGGKWYKLC